MNANGVCPLLRNFTEDIRFQRTALKTRSVADNAGPLSYERADWDSTFLIC